MENFFPGLLPPSSKFQLLPIFKQGCQKPPFKIFHSKNFLKPSKKFEFNFFSNKPFDGNLFSNKLPSLIKNQPKFFGELSWKEPFCFYNPFFKKPGVFPPLLMFHVFETKKPFHILFPSEKKPTFLRKLLLQISFFPSETSFLQFSSPPYYYPLGDKGPPSGTSGFTAPEKKISRAPGP